MKTKLYIIRHVETLGNIEKRLTGRKDYPFSEKGKRTLQILYSKLENVKFDLIYSSTTGRTEKTVKDLAELNDIEIIRKEDLCEMYFGKYDGWKWEDVNRENPTIKQNQNETNEIEGIEGQETTEEVTNRMYKCIFNICKENEGKTILICSHGVAIEAFLRKIEQVPFTSQREGFRQYSGTINELEYENGKFTILKLADKIHTNVKCIKVI